MNLAKKDKKSTTRGKGGHKKVEVLHQKILQILDPSPLPESSNRVSSLQYVERPKDASPPTNPVRIEKEHELKHENKESKR